MRRVGDSVAVGEAPDGTEQVVGCFDLGEVAGGSQQLEPRAGDGGGVGAAVVAVDDAVAVPLERQSGHGDAGEADAQGGIGHGRPAVDG